MATTRKTKVTKKKKKGSSRKKAPSRKKAKNSIYDREREQLQHRNRTSGTSHFWKPGDGRHVIRPLPFTDSEGMERLFVEDLRHWIEFDSEDKTNVPCVGDQCPICRLEDSVPKKVWEDIKPDRYMLVNAVHREGGEDGQDELKVVKLRITAYRKLAEYITKDLVDEDPLDPETGYDFKIVRSGSGFKTRYNVLPAARSSPLGGEYEPLDLTEVSGDTDMEELENLAARIEEKLG